jgi:hypothetical protein
MKYCGNITVYADHRDVALKFVYHLTKQLSLGSNGTRPTVFVLIDSILVFVRWSRGLVAPLVDSEGNSLDIDVIDTGRNVTRRFGQKY